jgi:Condensation domain
VARCLAARPIDAVSEPASHPLSLQQEALWFLERVGRGGSAYVEPIVRRLHGRLDLDALRCALTGVVERHDALRARFGSVRGRAVQVIEDREPPYEVIDLRRPGSSRPDDRLPEQLDQLSRAELDLRSGLVLRATVLRLADDDHVLHLHIHHIVADEWALTIVGQELAELYAARLESRRPGLAPVPLQYASYARWQRAWVADGGLAPQLGHWRRQLTPPPPALELTWDHPRPSARAERAGWVARRLDGWEVGDLVSVATSRGATPYLVLLAALMVLLHCRSGQARVSVGVPLANRRPEQRQTVGLFVNVLPIVADVWSAETFGSLLAQLRAMLFAALRNQEVPLPLLVRELSVPPAPGRNPLFQVALVVDQPPDPIRLPDLRVEQIDACHGIAKFDLMLVASTRTHPPQIGFEYSTDLLDRSTVEGLLDDLAVLLGAIRTGPDVSIGRLRERVGTGASA